MASENGISLLLRFNAFDDEDKDGGTTESDSEDDKALSTLKSSLKIKKKGKVTRKKLLKQKSIFLIKI